MPSRDYREIALTLRVTQDVSPGIAICTPLTRLLKLRRANSDMWNVPTYREEPWERDRRRVGEQSAREAWEKRQRELGLPLGGWSSSTGNRTQASAVVAHGPWTAAQRLLVIVALGGVLVTLTVLLALAVLERREEASGVSAAGATYSPPPGRALPADRAE
jgi:hypothetical protein